MNRSARYFGLALALVALYVALRSFDLPDPALPTWTVLAVALTLVSPLGGLTVLAALGPFTDAVTDDGRVTAVPFLVAALGLSILVRIVLARFRPRPSVPLILGIVLMASTALGVLHSYLAFGTDRGIAGAQLWVPGIGGAITVMIAGAWVALDREIRPLIVAVVAVVAGAGLSLLDLVTGGALQSGPLEWMLRGGLADGRLQGIIPAPDAAATIFLVGFAMCVAAIVLLGPVDRRGWLLAIAGAALTASAVAFTFSRSGLLAAGLAVVVVMARWRPRPGLLAAGALVLVAVAVVGLGLVRNVESNENQPRLDAWAASVRMTAASPLIGTGFRSFEWLHGDYGSIQADLPHNEFLRFFAEEGLVVGVAGLAFAVTTAWALVRDRRWVVAGAGAAAVSLFVMACFNNPFIYTQVNVPAFLVIGTGLGLAISREPSTPGERGRRALLDEVP